MRVIPVLDLQGGHVVHAVAGQRRSYRPLSDSILVDSSQPLDVACAFARQLSLNTCYLADLDAIRGGTPAWDVFHRMRAAGIQLWIDAGLGDVTRLCHFTDQAEAGGLDGIVVGLESVREPAGLPELARQAGATRGIFSLDLQQGRLLAGAAWDGWDMRSVARWAWDCGFRRLIVLDLADVGGGQGVATTADRCRALRGEHPWHQLIAGGGVREVDDLRQLAAAGCDAALVATALHRGTLTAADLAAWRAWDMGADGHCAPDRAP